MATTRTRTKGWLGRLSAAIAGLSFGLALATTTTPAAASGMYYSERGVRPLARGGAFVAGADDLGAITYNPAGIADCGTGILADFALVSTTTEFTRKVIIPDTAGNDIEVVSPKVTGTTPFIPIPTLAGSFAIPGVPFTVAAGVYAPYAALSEYPVTVDGQPSGSRYSLVSLEHSLLVIPGAYVAYKPIEQLRFGVGLEALVGNLQSQLVFNTSPPDRILAAPESPQYDANATLKTKTIVAPSGHFGVIAVPVPFLRVGASFRLPFTVNTPADLTVNLPSAAPFDNARQEGTGVNVRTKLPAVLRFGIEGRINDIARIEIAYVREFWDIHRSIAIEPRDIKFFGITGFPSPFPVPPVAITRNFKAANSFRLGGELTALKDPGIDLRAGVNYETSAVPDDYMTVLTTDLSHVTVALGVGVRPHPKWRFDAMFAHLFSSTLEVDPRTAGVSAVNPVRGNPTETFPINAGTYSNSGNIAGLGLTYHF